MGPGFLLMSSSDGQYNTSRRSQVSRHTYYIMASFMASNIVDGLHLYTSAHSDSINKASSLCCMLLPCKLNL